MTSGESVPVSVVVVTRDRPDMLRAALVALAPEVRSIEGAELVIVEQGGASAAALCAELGVDATVVADSGAGATRARNLGARRARGAVLAFTDDDCVVTDGWLHAHLAVLSDERIGATFGEVTGLSRRPGADPARNAGEHAGAVPPWYVGHSSNMAIRRSVHLSVGGFDERLGPGAPLRGGDDADLIARLLLAGHTLRGGVGPPVAHARWRTEEEERANVRTYDFGSGVWIGKALRTHGLGAKWYVRARLHVVWSTGSVRQRLVGTAVLGWGLLRGAFLRPWSEHDAAEPD